MLEKQMNISIILLIINISNNIMESNIMEKVAEQIKKDLNSSELVEKFKKIALERGIKYRSIEFQDVEIEENKIIIKIKTM